MNKSFFLPAVALVSFLIVAASCGSPRTTTSRYPYPGSPYPQGNPYPGNYPGDRYPDYGRYPNRYPPGHAKKIYRSKSAKVYAPGQRKKYDRYDRRDSRNDRKYRNNHGRDGDRDGDRRDARKGNRK